MTATVLKDRKYSGINNTLYRDDWKRRSLDSIHEDVILSNPAVSDEVLERFGIIWACINAKSRSLKKFNRNLGSRHVEEKIDYSYPVKPYPGSNLSINALETESFEREERETHKILSVYNGITNVKNLTEPPKGTTPPSREGEVIQKFSRKSRNRLLNKCLKMNKKELPLPYFVTLTYHENYQDCETSKEDHLNRFLDRWRDRCDSVGDKLGYIWKMEFQERGAIHYHLAFFLPEELNIDRFVSQDQVQRLKRKIDKNDNYAEKSGRELKLMALIGRDWAECTSEPIKAPVSKIKYTRKNKRVSHQTETGTVQTLHAFETKMDAETIVPDKLQEWYGTNVRTVQNWEQFIGYISKYLGKKQAPVEGQKTGRFWGMSNGFDFSPIFQCVVTGQQAEQLRSGLTEINQLSFESTIEHEKNKYEQMLFNAQKMFKKHKNLDKLADHKRKIREKYLEKVRKHQDRFKDRQKAINQGWRYMVQVGWMDTCYIMGEKHNVIPQQLAEFYQFADS